MLKVDSAVDRRSRRTLSHGPAVSQLGRKLPIVVSPDRADPSGVAAFHLRSTSVLFYQVNIGALKLEAKAETK